MKFYVGGCFDNYEDIRNIQDIIKLHGHEISYDWTIRAEKTTMENTNNTRTPTILMEEAELDINGVYLADWTVFLITKKDYVYRGTFCEVGASIMRDILRNQKGHTIIISNDDEIYAKTLCFFYHPDIVHVKSIEEAMKIIKQHLHLQ